MKALPTAPWGWGATSRRSCAQPNRRVGICTPETAMVSVNTWISVHFCSHIARKMPLRTANKDPNSRIKYQVCDANYDTHLPIDLHFLKHVSRFVHVVSATIANCQRTAITAW